MLILLDISYLLDIAARLLDPLFGRYSVIASNVQKMITEEKDGMTRFLQTLWHRRRGLIFDPDYPKEYCFAHGFSNWYTKLWVFCEKQNLSDKFIFYLLIH